MSLVTIPKLSELLEHPERVSQLPPETVPVMLGELERLRAILWARLSLLQASGNGIAESGDRLLNAKEAAAMLHTSADYLYRHARTLPFAVRLGRSLRFSQAGIERFIRQRVGQ